jgi:predicted membrane protein
MNGKRWVGIILILLGLLFLLEQVGAWDFGEIFREYWPVLLVLWGIWLLVRRATHQKERPVAGPVTGTASPDGLQVSETFGEIDLRSASKKFQGGTVNGVFGDLKVDASDAVLAEGEQKLTINGVFGSVRVLLPKGEAASVNATTVFGHATVFDTRQGGLSPTVNQESPEYSSAPRKLRVRVSTVFGDVEVKR